MAGRRSRRALHNAERCVATSSNKRSTIGRARFVRSIWNCYAGAAWNSTNVTFDPTPLPGLGTVLCLITGGLHHRLIFNIPPGLVSAVTKLVTELLPASPETIAKTNRQRRKYQRQSRFSLRVGDNAFDFSLKKIKKAGQRFQHPLNPGAPQKHRMKKKC
jgi:hypothetical protein